MAEPTKPTKPRAKRRNYQKLVESTTLFCEMAIKTCEDFREEAAAASTPVVIDAQIRAYKRVLQMLNGETA